MLALDTSSQRRALHTTSHLTDMGMLFAQRVTCSVSARAGHWCHDVAARCTPPTQAVVIFVQVVAEHDSAPIFDNSYCETTKDLPRFTVYLCVL